MGASPSVPQKSIHEFTVKVLLCFFFFLLQFSTFICLVIFHRSHVFLWSLWVWIQDARGQDVDLSIYKGKVLLVVNVASKWFSLFLATSLCSTPTPHPKNEVINLDFDDWTFVALLQWIYRFELHAVDRSLQQIQG